MLYQLSYAHHITHLPTSIGSGSTGATALQPESPETRGTSTAQHDSNIMVRTERLELSRLAALEPKSSVSTNSTTSARGNA